MRILLFGSTGQLGRDLERALVPLGHLIAVSRHDGTDFTQPSNVAAALRRIGPDVIVNAAAYTAVDEAESNAHTAMTVNATTPGVLAEEAARRGAWLVHFSTDYVFDGSGTRSWKETDAASPVNVYGQSKLAGEENIRNAGCHHLILRSSWLYSLHGNNFPNTILKRAREGAPLQVVNDQFGAPTASALLADITARAFRKVLDTPALGGLYHAAASGDTSWHAYAQYVITRARLLGMPLQLSADDVNSILSQDFPGAARRPLNCRLDTSKLRTTFDLKLPDWRIGVDAMLAQHAAKLRRHD